MKTASIILNYCATATQRALENTKCENVFDKVLIDIEENMTIVPSKAVKKEKKKKTTSESHH